MLQRFFSFFKMISGISNHIQKISSAEMKKHGLKGSFVQYLTVLDRFENGVTATQLCKVCDRDKAAVSRALCEMEKQGLVKRLVQDRKMYRIRLTLTEKGKKAALFVRETASRAMRLAGEGLSVEKREVLYEALQLISDNLEILSEKGLPQE